MSLSVRLRAMFDDMHFVYAGMGAAAATVVCIDDHAEHDEFRGAHQSRLQPESRVVDARMLVNAWPAAVLAIRCRACSTRDSTGGPRSRRWGVYVVGGGDPRRTPGEPRGSSRGRSDAGRRQQRGARGAEMLGAMSQARFEPARVAGLPIAVNMVWLVTHTTVRGTEGPKVFPAAPIAKKRRVDVNVAPTARKTVVA